MQQRLNINPSLHGQEDGYISTILPEDVVVDILSDRFMSPDCSRGIVIDSLETLFCPNLLNAATAVLKAFNNRRYIYCFTLKSDFHKYKEQLNRILEGKSWKFNLVKKSKDFEFEKKFVSAKQKVEKDELERIELEEMDEESYEALPEQRRREIDNKLLHTKKLRLKR